MDWMLVFTGWVVYKSCSLEGLDFDPPELLHI